MTKPSNLETAGNRSRNSNPFVMARASLRLSRPELARRLGTSLYALCRWERGDVTPSSDVLARLMALVQPLKQHDTDPSNTRVRNISFESTGVRKKISRVHPLFPQPSVSMRDKPRESILEEIFTDSVWKDGHLALGDILERHCVPAKTKSSPFTEYISAGKNTYTYDAHTYHTKVPPQGIATLISQYLPDGGVILDPFSGSGMTGVAARYLGYDVILNELSPAASFISYGFVSTINVVAFQDALSQILSNLSSLQKRLYTTTCRECNSDVVALYTVWSYVVECNVCNKDLILWDHCKQFGRTVREHRILRRFPCPYCANVINKSYLRRKQTVPVFLGYRCCSKKLVERPLEEGDYLRIDAAAKIADEYANDIPNIPLPDGVNLNQPKRHGLDTIAKLYTPRNLAACAAIWKEIRRIDDPELAYALAFVFTSLYQRVTRLSEYRFWGGSGNTANYNVPQIFREYNVFVTYKRKAQSIRDHLESTARHYRGDTVLRTGSATDMEFLPDNSIDFIFTDPPFGSNINYSEMNFLWESWLGRFTDTGPEAIINRVQGKDVNAYERLMADSLREAHRVLRPDHWMILVFMNSSEKVWNALNRAINESGFSIRHINIFDKHHNTFKQYVSGNTAGADLMIHCQKRISSIPPATTERRMKADVSAFIAQEKGRVPIAPFIHVDRKDEVDYRTLYSRYIAKALQSGESIVDFAEFRQTAGVLLRDNG